MVILINPDLKNLFLAEFEKKKPLIISIWQKSSNHDSIVNQIRFAMSETDPLWEPH